ncbi:primosomal replication protein [Pseudoalteromonas denitrificans]|uniref:Restart primosome assembly protein PriC n=1 Tax=Pseudoalteromonas denitrificans DSM 6059 TaxID=1123010 RepID=A0A1I1I148_9GAMM|nr:primosomal replication protein [Pseudoalteromonas denitrificans]SFC30027.1 restart primosome assembly protein PriC [Pseudoalteromonas denitrificans DSM 6059]
MKAQAVERLNIQIEKIKLDAQHFDNEKWFDKNRYMKSKRRLFDLRLFNTRSMILLDYVNELSETYHSLLTISNQQSYEYVIDRLTAQLEAVIRVLKSTSVWQSELTTNKLVKNKSLYKKTMKKETKASHPLYHELTKNKEFERRLLAMIAEKKTILHKSITTNKNEISKDILATQGRLERCRKAISLTEDKIKKLR